MTRIWKAILYAGLFLGLIGFTGPANAAPDTPIIQLINTQVEQRFNGELYWVLDSNQVTVYWDAVDHPDLDHYEIKVVWMDTGQEYPTVVTTDTQYTFTAPRAGHFKIMVKAVAGSGESSDWADSSDSQYATVDGVQMAWIIYFKMSPPSW